MIPLTSKDCSSNPTHGVKTIRQLKKSQENMFEKRRNAMQEKQIEMAYDYFSKEVDPIISECITFLLCTQPESPIDGMLECLDNRKAGRRYQKPLVDEKSMKTKKAQRIYLATHVSPLISKLINDIARKRPKFVSDYLYSELEVMSGKTTHSTYVEPAHPIQVNRSSSTRNKIKEARELANNYVASPQAMNMATRPESAPLPIRISTTPSKPVQSPVKSNLTVHNVQILFLGIGSSGKTSLINCLQGNAGAKTRPTIGFRPISMMLGEDLKVKFYDLGGGKKIRDIWEQYYYDVHAIVFVIDSSSNEEELNEQVQIFQDAIGHTLLANKPVLIIANKQDKDSAIDPSELQSLLNLDNLNSINKIYGCSCASTGKNAIHDSVNDAVDAVMENVDEDDTNPVEIDPNIESSFEWLLTVIKSNYEVINDRVMRDTKRKEEEEAQKRLEKERKVLKKKIACAFPHLINRTLYAEELPEAPEDVFTAEEGINFLAGEIGVEPAALEPDAIEITELIGNQRLALQMIGALHSPINKKKIPMTWRQIKHMILELRMELGLF